MWHTIINQLDAICKMANFETTFFIDKSDFEFGCNLRVLT